MFNWLKRLFFPKQHPPMVIVRKYLPSTTAVPAQFYTGRMPPPPPRAYGTILYDDKVIRLSAGHRAVRVRGWIEEPVYFIF